MANGKKVIKTEEPIPNFLDLANALIEETYQKSELNEDPKRKPGLNIQDHKLWVSVMDLHVTHVNDIIVKAFTDKIVEHYEPIMRSLAGLETQQETIVNDIKSLKFELTELSRIHFADVKEINSKLAKDDREIKNIKQLIEEGKKKVLAIEADLHILQPELINTFLDRISKITPTLDSIKKDQDRILKSQRVRNIAKRIAIAVAISALVTWIAISISFYVHNKNSQNQLPKTEIPK